MLENKLVESEIIFWNSKEWKITNLSFITINIGTILLLTMIRMLLIQRLNF